MLEHIIVHTIMDFAENNNILCREQHGFRKNRSCISQLLGLMDEISHSRDTGKQTDMLVMDFAKAFDNVSHSLLTHKLQHYGITGSVNNWITSFLKDRRQAVVVDGATSAFVPGESGMPQESVLAPCPLPLPVVHQRSPQGPNLYRPALRRRYSVSQNN